MQPVILLISGNYYPEPTGIGKYNGEMMSWLADNGCTCTVIATYPYYPFWKIQEPYTKKHKWFQKEVLTTSAGNTITVYRCPHYIPNKPTGKKRMLLDFSFFVFATLKLISLTGKKFDCIINVTPPLSLGLVAAFYRNISKAKFFYHIQDLQVDAANALNMISSKKFIQLLLNIESYVMKKADKISTISEGIAAKIKMKTAKPVYIFPNWVDTTQLFPLPCKGCLKQKFGFNPNTPLILYSGSIGEKQGLEAILTVAEIFMQKKIAIQFVICGSSPYKTMLEEKARSKQLNNTNFLPLQPFEKMNEFLNMADAHLVLQKSDVADHVMPSKLTAILSVGGLAIVTANEGSELYKMISQHNAGLLCRADDVTALYQVIHKTLNNDYDLIRKNARYYAESFLSIDKIMTHYKKNILELAV